LIENKKIALSYQIKKPAQEFTMHTNSNLLDVVSKDKRHFITIPFSLKDDFKRNFSTAKWHNSEKKWSVGSRSLKKLEKWIDSVKTTLKEENEKKEAFIKSLEKMKVLNGNTFSIKEQLKEKFNAIYHDKKWYVEAKNYDEAQNFVNEMNNNRVTQSMIDTQRNNVDKLNSYVEKIISNFDDDGSSYLIEDELYDFIRYNASEDEVFTVLNEFNRDLFYAAQEAEELESYILKSDDSAIEILDFLNIPQFLYIDENLNINDYANIEESIINELIENNKYNFINIEEASKKVNSSGGYKPYFHFLSSITQKEYDCKIAEIITTQTSANVTVYSANAPILHSENFKTKMNFWWNKNRETILNDE